MALLEATLTTPDLVTHEVRKILGRPPKRLGHASPPIAICSPIDKEDN